MPLSIQKLRGLPATSLGFVQVANNGTPVALSKNIDANNTNAPGTVNPPPAQFPGPGQEYTPAFRGFHVSGFHPGNNNNGMVPNSGYIYLLQAPAGNGSGNRSDSGAILAIIGPGQDYFFPPEATGTNMFSPYYYFLDADVDGEGGLVGAYGGGNP